MPPDARYILLNHLRPDFLPGLCLWTSSSTKLQPKNIDFSNIGKPTGTYSNGKSITTSSSTESTTDHTTLLSYLKKLNISSGKNKAHTNLIITILDKPQEQVRPSGIGAYKVWVQKLMNPWATQQVID